MCACGAIESALNEKNLLNIVELILNSSSDPEIEVNSCDRYYQTPLMYACRAGNHILIDCLVKFGASLDAVDENNWTV
jgi:ankyrin repeat protein